VRPFGETGQFGSRRLRCSALLLAVLCLRAECETDLVGQASVIDGDTIEIHSERIRIFGIDAPESAQLCRGSDSVQYRCGTKAANELDRFIGKGVVECIPVNFDRYGRKVATCSVNGRDIGEWLVRNGLALDWPRYSRGKYASAQTKAAHEELGVWAGSFTVPWRYRECIKRSAGIPECSDL
jgi:endonuclease YncB( thermonuclease family)